MLSKIRPERAAIEEGAAAAHHFAIDAAGDDVAGTKLRILVHRAHEALAAAVDQHRTLAAQSLGGERGGIAADIDGGRMELHELGVGDHGAGTGGNGDAFAARFARIGGDRIELARAAGGEHHGGGVEHQGRSGSGVTAHKLDTGDLPSRMMRSRAPQPSSTGIEGVARAASISAAMMARPAVSPLTCRIRRAPCAASRPSSRWPSRSLSKGTP